MIIYIGGWKKWAKWVQPGNRIRFGCACAAMRSCVGGSGGECSPSDFPGAWLFSIKCPPPCRAAARGSPFCAAGRGEYSPQIFFDFICFWMKSSMPEASGVLICAAGRCEFSPLNAFGGDYFIRPAAGRGEFSPLNAVSTRGTFWDLWVLWSLWDKWDLWYFVRPFRTVRPMRSVKPVRPVRHFR